MQVAPGCLCLVPSTRRPRIHLSKALRVVHVVPGYLCTGWRIRGELRSLHGSNEGGNFLGSQITPNIERAVPKPHEAAASQARKVLEEPPPKLGASKRVFLNLNGWSDPGVKQYLEVHGCELVELRGFAGQARATAALALVKALIREGRAIWLNIRVGNAHGHNPRWVPPCCRRAHRAGVPWTVRFTKSQPWRIHQYNALRIYKYSCLKRSSGSPKYPMSG